jgi:hypothetical protein
MSETASVCVPNIGPGERKKRLFFGVLFTTLSVLLAGFLVVRGASWHARALLFVPLWIGALGLFQVKEKTCVALAGQGTRNLDSGPEPIADQSERLQVQRQARKVQMEALLAALFLTGVVLAVHL